MPRTRLDEQPVYEFSCRIVLQPRDINYGGHLGNDSLVSLIGTARAGMLHSMELTEGNLGDNKTGVVIGDLAVNFKSEGFMFDELRIDTHIGEITKTGFRMFHRVTKDKSIIALAEAGMVAFDYTTRKIGHVPDKFVEALEQFKPKP